MNAGSAERERHLQTLVRVAFPPRVRTIGAALDHLLSRNGWRLADPDNADSAIKDRLQQALPESQRRLRPLRLIDAIQALCGEPFTIVVDPDQRLIACELRKPEAHHESA